MKYFIALSLLTLGAAATTYGLSFRELEDKGVLTNQDIQFQKMKDACARVIKDHELILKEEREDYWKLVSEIPTESEEPQLLQVVVSCGRILLPIDFTGHPEIKKPRKDEMRLFKEHCVEMTNKYGFILKQEKASSWKLAPEMQGLNTLKEGHVSVILNCGPIIIPIFGM